MLRGNNWFYQNVPGNSIPAQSVSTITTVAGRTISEPWRIARQITWLFNGGAFAATASGRLKIEGLRRDDGTTWEDIVLPGTSTALEFTATKLDDAGAGENGILQGTLDLSMVDGTTYKALRCKWYNEVAVAALVSVVDVLSDFIIRPAQGALTDELFSQMLVDDSPA